MKTINNTLETDRTRLRYPFIEEAQPRQTEAQRLIQAIKKTQNYLLKRQAPAGYWVGELEADASVSAGYIPLMYFMLGEVDPERQQKVINFVKSKQAVDGSWSTYYGGDGDLNVSIQVYFAMKLAGIPASEPFMQQARNFILARGGISQANVFTKIWLALFGQFDWRGTPTVPSRALVSTSTASVASWLLLIAQ